MSHQIYTAIGHQRSAVFDRLRGLTKRFAAITDELLDLWSEEWHGEEPAFLGGTRNLSSEFKSLAQGLEVQGVRGGFTVLLWWEEYKGSREQRSQESYRRSGCTEADMDSDR
jgi:hypothetical protein